MPTNCEQLRILAAGDCAAEQPLLARLVKMGVEIHVKRFICVEEAVAKLQHWAADLILVDADCARFCAPTLCRDLKASPITGLWPILIASCSSVACKHALAAGADDFITPEIPPESLLNRLQGIAALALARRRAGAGWLETDEPPRETANRWVRREYEPPTPEQILADESQVCNQAVVLFADLRGYSRMAERLSPPRLVPFLNEYFALLTDITYRHQGTIFNMAGDSLLVGFGVPHEQPDRAQRAIDTAQEMLARFAELAKLWRDRSDLVAGLGVGLHEGPVAAATVGSSRFNCYTLVGDAVNIASRLCQRARAGEIVFSGTFGRTFDARAIVLPALQLPPLTFRGRSESIDILCVPLEKRLNLVENVPPLAPVAQRALRQNGPVVRLVTPPQW